MKISQIFKDFKERKGNQVERRSGRRQERGEKEWPYSHLLPPEDTQALWDFTLGLQKREAWNSALPGTRPEQNQNSSSLPKQGDQSPIRLRPFNQIPASRPGGLENRGRIGRVKERKERGKAGEVNKVPCSLPSRGILASCLGQEETRVKRVPVAATGSGPLVGKLVPEYPEWSRCQSP